MKSNCVNCGAPHEDSENKCSYCLTSIEPKTLSFEQQSMRKYIVDVFTCCAVVSDRLYPHELEGWSP